MALITLQQMYDAWKRVADWVSGANTDKPPVRVTDGTDTLAINPDGSLPVQLTGSKVVEKSTLINTATAVTAGSTYRFGIRDIGNILDVSCNLRLDSMKKFTLKLRYDRSGILMNDMGTETVINNSSSAANTGVAQVSLKGINKYYWEITNNDTSDFNILYFDERRFL